MARKYSKQEAKIYNWGMALICGVVVVVFVAAGA